MSGVAVFICNDFVFNLINAYGQYLHIPDITVDIETPPEWAVFVDFWDLCAKFLLK